MTERIARESENEERPQYETPRIQVMTEKEILQSFQVTQAMATWWISC